MFVTFQERQTVSVAIVDGSGSVTSGEPGRSLSLGVVRSAWQDGLARRRGETSWRDGVVRWRGETARRDGKARMPDRERERERERERDGLQTERPRETNDGGERKNELNKAKQCIAFFSVPSHI